MDYRSRQALSDAPTFFYAQPNNITVDYVRLRSSESRHAVRVCRLTQGQRFIAIDGCGLAYRCFIESTDPGGMIGRIEDRYKRLGEDDFAISLAFGCERLPLADWVIEKATELGVAAFIPFAARDSEAGLTRRLERLNRIALAAAKQALRSVIPPIRPAASLNDVLTRVSDYDVTVLADPATDRPTLTEHITAQPPRRILLIVGPEEGIGDIDRETIYQRGAHALSLGVQRLRAETAAIVAPAILKNILTSNISSGSKR